MMFTHDEMLSAVRTAGESGRTFTCGAVRDCLGVKSGDRERISQFHRRFRTFQKEATDEIEKVGKNAYRLKHPERTRTEAPVIAHLAEAEADAHEVAPEELIELEIEVVADEQQEAAAEPLEVLPDESLPNEPPPPPSTTLESMEKPLRMIEIDFDVPELPPEPSRAVRAPAQPMIRAWLDRGQALGRRVAGFFGRA